MGRACDAAAGVAWGAYSLLGRSAAAPLAANAGNFVRTLPAALALVLLATGLARLAPSLLPALAPHASPRGLALAAASGALTSGVGYAIWYAVIGRLGALRAATVQLSVPLIAAAAGVLLLDEALTPRLAVACLAIVGGIALVLGGRARRQG